MAIDLIRMRRLAQRAARAWLNWMPLSSSARFQLKQACPKWLAGLLSPPAHPGRLSARGDSRRPHSGGPAIGYRAYRDLDPPECRATVVAFYLPQFHPIAENDAWWGKGFTEWSNVSRAVPQFEGHTQPQLPGDLGFYDLRLPEVMQQQVELARQHGIGAFCFYYYWFGGHQVLELPVQSYLRRPELDLPFCLCWANEPWTRRWDGREQDVLLKQEHSPADDLAFIASVRAYLQDPRYLRIDGRPILVIYRPELLPNPKATAERWRHYCHAAGIGDIHLACVESFERRDPSSLGFDSAIEFPPNLADAAPVAADIPLANPGYEGEILDWRAMSVQFRLRTHPAYRLFRGVNPAWDNEARRPGHGRSFVHAAPRRYEDWLREAIDDAISHSRTPSDRLVFVNAWNEWAEGAHLEPDARLGHAWLQATRRANSPPRQTLPNRPCVVLHAHYPELVGEILQALTSTGLTHRLIVTTSPEREVAVREVLQALSTDADLRVFANRGRDILPFLNIADELIDEGEQVVLKIHTKHSPHLPDGHVWLTELLQNLLSAHNAHNIMKAFAHEPKLGLVGPTGHLLDAGEHVGGNEACMAFLTRQLGLRVPRSRSMLFFAGSMFWARLDALRPLLDAHLEPWLFEPEQGQRDGTLAHAVERIIPSAVQAAGYWLAASSQPTIEVRAADKHQYRFAPEPR